MDMDMVCVIHDLLGFDTTSNSEIITVFKTKTKPNTT